MSPHMTDYPDSVAHVDSSADLHAESCEISRSSLTTAKGPICSTGVFAIRQTNTLPRSFPWIYANFVQTLDGIVWLPGIRRDPT